MPCQNSVSGCSGKFQLQREHWWPPVVGFVFFCMVFLVEPSLASMASFALRKVCRCCGWMGEALQGIVKYCKPSGYVVVGSMIMTLLERQVQFCNLLAVPKLTLPNGLQNLSLHRSMCTFRTALGWICKFEDRTFRSCKHIPCLKEFVFAGLSALFGSMSFNKSLSQFSISLSGTPSGSKHTPGTPPPKFWFSLFYCLTDKPRIFFSFTVILHDTLAAPRRNYTGKRLQTV